MEKKPLAGTGDSREDGFYDLLLKAPCVTTKICGALRMFRKAGQNSDTLCAQVAGPCAARHANWPTQGKFERWHQTLKHRFLPEDQFLPGDLEAQIKAFIDHYNHQHDHESSNNVTPADVDFGRDKAILKQRQRIKRKTLETRRLHHRQHAA